MQRPRAGWREATHARLPGGHSLAASIMEMQWALVDAPLTACHRRTFARLDIDAAKL